HALQEAPSRLGIAVPAVGPDPAPLWHVEPGGAHLRRLAEELPLPLGSRKTLAKPAFLIRAEHRALRVVEHRAFDQRATGVALRIGAGVMAAELPAVERPQFGEAAPGKTVVDPHRRALWWQRERHVLEVGLVGRRTPAQELRGVGVGRV